MIFFPILLVRMGLTINCVGAGWGQRSPKTHGELMVFSAGIRQLVWVCCVYKVLTEK